MAIAKRKLAEIIWQIFHWHNPHHSTQLNSPNVCSLYLKGNKLTFHQYKVAPNLNPNCKGLFQQIKQSTRHRFILLFVLGLLSIHV